MVLILIAYRLLSEMKAGTAVPSVPEIFAGTIICKNMMGGAKGLGMVSVTLLLIIGAAWAHPTLVLGQPSSAIAVATNKSVYEPGDRVLIIGSVNMGNDDNNNNNNNNGTNIDQIKLVTVKVTKDDALCGQQFVRIERDGSFISRSMRLSCGLGDYNVTATFGSEIATTGFRVAGSDSANKNTNNNSAQFDEVAQIRSSIEQAKDGANARIKELVQDEVPIPTQAVARYQLGASEYSLAVQSIQAGELPDAHRHADAAIAYFAETLDILSPDNVRALLQPPEVSKVPGEEGRLAAAADKYNRLADNYRTLVNLAEKNGFSDKIFDDIQSVLVEAKRLLGVGDIKSVEPTLAITESMMNKAHDKLVEQANNNNNSDNSNIDNSTDNSSITASAAYLADKSEALNLSASAERLEKRAERQLDDVVTNAQLRGQVNDAVDLITLAKSAIDEANYTYARLLLSSASKILIDVNQLTHTF